MASSSLKVSHRDNALWVTITREEVRNALNDELIVALTEAIESSKKEPTTRAIVITGQGDRAFCAGADLKPGAATFAFDAEEPTTTYAQLLRVAHACTLPLIARVNGHCMAGGMGVLGMCDMAVASSRAKFGLPEVAIGMFPMQVAVVLQGMIPRRKFQELCLTGEPITADEALEIGLVNYVVDPEQLDEKLEWLLARIVNKSPIAIRRGKYALAAIADMTFEQSLFYMENQLASMALTADSAEGLRSFNEKRPPVWPVPSRKL